tara:strand:- start:345 stop:713 length:369 start_codon:yes stop_codon:yes gene_type:complete
MGLKTNEQNSEFSAMATQTGASTVADRDIFASGPGTIRTIFAKNTNGSTLHYLKVYDSKEPTVGTTEPEFILELGTSITTTVYCNPGIVCATGVSVTAGTGAGHTAGSNPGSTEVPYTIYGA